MFVFSFFMIDKAYAKTCTFCRPEIIEEQWVLKGKYFNVVLDYEPRVRGHLLVISKRHVSKAHELCKEEWEELNVIIPRVVRVFSEFLHTDEYIILEKNGPKAFQQVPHVHFHLFPVTTQSWSEIFDIVPKQLSREVLEEEIALFRSYFAS